VSQLTIDEKIGLMNNKQAAIKRLNVPQYEFWTGPALHQSERLCINLSRTLDALKCRTSPRTHKLVQAACGAQQGHACFCTSATFLLV
jgi:hypothetical protein